MFVFDTLADREPGYAVAGIGNAGFQSRPGICPGLSFQPY